FTRNRVSCREPMVSSTGSVSYLSITEVMSFCTECTLRSTVMRTSQSTLHRQRCVKRMKGLALTGRILGLLACASLSRIRCSRTAQQYGEWSTHFYCHRNSFKLWRYTTRLVSVCRIQEYHKPFGTDAKPMHARNAKNLSMVARLNAFQYNPRDAQLRGERL